jgi:PTH1 family peptidyl-tRNA hydrolase
MIILVGLGNPGEKYARHRHNVGYMAVDAIAEANGFGPPRRKFHGEMREGFLDGPNGREKAVILKPQTYMNNSGQSVRAAADFYKLAPSDIVVFYDEIDLAPGKVRVKTGGGAAGHNGIRSIDAHLGNDFRRVRLGIGHPGDKSKVSGHVLGNFAKADQEWLAPLLDAVAAAAPFLTTDDQRFATDVSRRMASLKPARPETSAGAEPEAPGAPSPAAPKNQPAGPFAALKKLFRRSGD